jgi:hypothetical protein|tara:strand:- start:1393 stop:1722 length:330 start_codon:yes stop_codon:yes gene_type:complete
MATIFRNAVITKVGETPIDVFTVAPNRKNIVLGISLANVKDSTVLGSVHIRDEGSVTAFYVKDAPIPPNGTLRAMNGGEKLILDSGHTLQVSCSFTDGVDAIVSFVEQT